MYSLDINALQISWQDTFSETKLYLERTRIQTCCCSVWELYSCSNPQFPNAPIAHFHWIPWGTQSFSRNKKYMKTLFFVWRFQAAPPFSDTVGPPYIFVIQTYPLGAFFTDKEHHPALQSNATLPEISMSFDRCINRDTLISRALITSAQILSTPGTLPLWRPFQWPLPKRWAKTLLRILKRGCCCWVFDPIKVFLPPFDGISSQLSVIYLLMLRSTSFKESFARILWRLPQSRSIDKWLNMTHLGCLSETPFCHTSPRLEN